MIPFVILVHRSAPEKHPMWPKSTNPPREVDSGTDSGHMTPKTALENPSDTPLPRRARPFFPLLVFHTDCKTIEDLLR
jgi:hypothetical protein